MPHFNILSSSSPMTKKKCQNLEKESKCQYSKYFRNVFVVQSLSCVQLFFDPIDCTPLGSSVHEISQPKTLEWVAISFSRGSSRPRDPTCIACIGKWILYHWATWEVHFRSVAYARKHNLSLHFTLSPSSLTSFSEQQASSNTSCLLGYYKISKILTNMLCMVMIFLFKIPLIPVCPSLFRMFLSLENDDIANGKRFAFNL